jgi:hypothetical protein
VSIDIDSDGGGAVSKTAKPKRHWTHDEEVGLVITQHQYFY